MDYKRNRRYFESINWVFIAIVGMITAIILYFFLLIGIAILLGLGVYIYFKLKDRPTDEEIDDMLQEYVHKAVQRGYRKLGLDTEDLEVIDPMMIHGPLLEQISYDPAVKKGKDQQVRSSNHQVIIFYFKEREVYFYHQSFSLIDDEQNEVMGECSYRDIVAISTGSTTTLYFDSAKRRDEFFKLGFFKLIVLGSINVECSVLDFQKIETQIRKMKRLIRQKKST